MKYLVLLRPTDSCKPHDFRPYVIEEAKAILATYKTGILREHYFQASPMIVTLIYETPSASDVLLELNRLPLVEAKLLDIQIVELAPWVPYDVLIDDV